MESAFVGIILGTIRAKHPHLPLFRSACLERPAEFNGFESDLLLCGGFAAALVGLDEEFATGAVAGEVGGDGDHDITSCVLDTVPNSFAPTHIFGGNG